MLEQYKYKNRPDFRLYMTETNVFVPWFYKEHSGQEKAELMKKFEEDIEKERARRAAKRAKREKQL